VKQGTRASVLTEWVSEPVAEGNAKVLLPQFIALYRDGGQHVRGAGQGLCAICRGMEGDVRARVRFDQFGKAVHT